MRLSCPAPESTPEVSTRAEPEERRCSPWCGALDEEFPMSLPILLNCPNISILDPSWPLCLEKDLPKTENPGVQYLPLSFVAAPTSEHRSLLPVEAPLTRWSVVPHSKDVIGAGACVYLTCASYDAATIPGGGAGKRK